MYFKTGIVMILFAFLLQSCTTAGSLLLPAGQTGVYKVSVEKSNIRKVNVEALLSLSTDTIKMSQGDFEPLPNGFATFVNDLSATNEEGRKVGLTSIGKGIWKVAIPVPAVIHVRYFVAIGHDTVQWKVSAAFARAYSVDDVLFFAGRSIFIAPVSANTSRFLIHYQVPKDWLVATPYAETKEAYTFQAASLADLWNNGNFIGKLNEQEIHIDSLQVIIAGNQSMSGSIALFKEVLTKIVTLYSSAMGGAPKGKLVIMASVSSLPGGGETFSKSISLMFSQPPALANKIQWGYLLSHEIFHLWNGHAIAPANQPQVEWFVEGFTEYISKLMDFRSGLISESEFLGQLAYSYGTYKSVAGRISMVEAGNNKGQNYNHIYFGGMMTAMAIDLECRHLTGNKKGIMNIMQKMYSQFGISNTPYRYTDIISACNDVAGTDFSGFFKSYVSGIKIIPVNDYLHYAGLQLGTANGENDIEVEPGISKETLQFENGFLYN